MREQTLELSKLNGRIVIETPEGLVCLTWLGGRRFHLTMPDHVVAHRSEERAMKSARFLTGSADSPQPTYEMLEPVVSPDGSIEVKPVALVKA